MDCDQFAIFNFKLNFQAWLPAAAHSAAGGLTLKQQAGAKQRDWII
jgi:hypothetical protein